MDVCPVEGVHRHTGQETWEQGKYSMSPPHLRPIFHCAQPSLHCRRKGDLDRFSQTWCRTCLDFTQNSGLGIQVRKPWNLKQVGNWRRQTASEVTELQVAMSMSDAYFHTGPGQSPFPPRRIGASRDHSLARGQARNTAASTPSSRWKKNLKDSRFYE